jgi:hypothetical protein
MEAARMNSQHNVQVMFALRGKHDTRSLIFAIGLLACSGCGAGMPWPTTQVVQYFPQLENQPVRTNKGTWKLSGSDVVLSDFLSIGWNDKRLSMTWWVTHWFSTRLVLFGGDLPDPDHWSLLSRHDLVDHAAP